MIKVTLITNNPRKTIIVPENKTVRQILEENDINYAMATTAVDGATLAVGEMDETLSDMGLTEKAVISVLANKNNAAKAQIIGSAAVITSDLTPDQIKTVKKYHPEALTLYDEEEEPIFAVDVEEDSTGSINACGAVFGSAVNADGKATITCVIDPALSKEDLLDKLGRPILKLTELEKNMPDVLDKVKSEVELVKAAIEFM